jgi:hypothetical protein
MTRETVLMILGALVFLSPWVGIPMMWLQWILLVLGLAIIAIGVTLRRRMHQDELPPATPSPSPSHPATPEPRSSHIAFS